MKTRMVIFGIIAAVFLTTTSESVKAQEAHSAALRINGAAIASDIVQRWAEGFMQSHPETRVVVVGSSAGKGFLSLFGKQAEVAMVSRLISDAEKKTAEEKGLKLSERSMGYSGLGIYTNPRNPLNELTLHQLRKIFAGQIDNWKQLGGPDEPIRALARRMPESGAVVFFWENVMEKEPFGKETVFTENWSTIFKACATGQDLAIGLGPVPLDGNRSGAKLLGIKKDEHSPAVLPSEETLRNKSYPIIVQFYFYWDSQTTDKRIMEFINYCAKKGSNPN